MTLIDKLVTVDKLLTTKVDQVVIIFFLLLSSPYEPRSCEYEAIMDRVGERAHSVMRLLKRKIMRNLYLVASIVLYTL